MKELNTREKNIYSKGVEKLKFTEKIGTCWFSFSTEECNYQSDSKNPCTVVQYHIKNFN